MSIANELSSDVAAELLKRRERFPNDTRAALAEVVLELHDTLRDLKVASDGQRRRRSQGFFPPTPEYFPSAPEDMPAE
jgi:hypothetical protein